MSGITNPFNKLPKKVISNTKNHPNNKTDTIRENAKKNLKNALNINEDKEEIINYQQKIYLNY